MKRIVAFIDFTEGCKVALSQASVIARTTGAEIYLLYVMRHDEDEEAKKKELLDFAHSVPGMPENMYTRIGTGELLDGAVAALRRIDPDLVVIGTHGIKGIKQHLFGAYILKLVQSIPYPSLVVQENTVVNPGGFAKILFPVGPGANYQMKIDQTANIARVFHSKIIHYQIDKSTGSDDLIRKNSHAARDYFEANGFAYDSVIEEPTVVSVGYSRQTLKYAEENQMDLLAVMAAVPTNEAFYGKADKENLLTNELGIPVLCCND